MGTSSTIVFKDEYDVKYFVNRGSDGFPDVVIPDIKKAIEEKKDSWSGSEIGLMVSSFLGMTYEETERLPDYEIMTGPRGDDSYQYYVFYNKQKQEWQVSYGNLPYSERIIEKLKAKEPIVCQKCFEQATAEKENKYNCSNCKTEMEITYDKNAQFKEFKINGKYENIVFIKEESKE